MGFGALAHVPKMNVSHALLGELINYYDEYHGCLKTLHRKIYITPRKIAAALGINHSENRFPKTVEYSKLNEVDKAIFDSLKCVMLVSLTKSVVDMSVEGEENRQKFRRTFVVFIHKCFMLPTTFPCLDAPDASPPPWVAHWTKKMMLDRITKEATDTMIKKQQEKLKAVPPIQKAEVNSKTKKKKLKKQPQRKENNHRRWLKKKAKKGGMCRRIQRAQANLKASKLSTVNLGSEPILQTRASSTPSVNAPDNTSSLKTQQQPYKEALARQSKQEGPVDVCPAKLEKQAAEESFPRKMEPEPPLNVLGISPPASQPTPPSQVIVTQPTQPSEPTVSEHEVLADAVVDAGVTATLKFAEATSTNPSFTAAEVYKTPKKEKEITEELKEKCYHLMTHVKETKYSTDEYDPLFFLNHQANFERLRHHFMSLMHGQHVESTVVNTHCMILNDMKCPHFEKDIYCVPTDIIMFVLENHGEKYIDPKTKKSYRFDVDRYAHQRQFLDKRKLASHPFLFVLICNGENWWLCIADVQKKAFYVLDPVNKNKNKIPDLRIKLNKFFGLIISQMRVYIGAEPLMEDGDGEEAEYIRLNGQRTSCVHFLCN
ncbi:hypothetical protein AHAS_Ahas19G0283600 [Arachis hypogaea]